MVGRLLTFSFIPSMAMGVIYLSIILWWLTGFTPIDLVNAVVQPLQEALR